MKKTSLLLNKGKETTIAEKKCYQRMIDSIIFMIVEIRPNIAYTMLVMSRFAKHPSHFYNKAIKTVFCYLKATRDIGIIYGVEQKGDLIIKGFSDSN